jgi:hypothetical protein
MGVSRGFGSGCSGPLPSFGIRAADALPCPNCHHLDRLLALLWAEMGARVVSGSVLASLSSDLGTNWRYLSSELCCTC